LLLFTPLLGLIALAALLVRAKPAQLEGLGKGGA
jgi:hypothetical protein